MRVVFIPGFTQTSASWAEVVAAATPGIEPVLLEVDGQMRWHSAVATLAGEGGFGTWVGYSMGGRLALQVALDFPDLVERLVLISATAGLANESERQSRRAQDEVLAESLESDGIETFIARWLAQPMFARVPADAPGMRERLDIPASMLAATLRNLGTGMMPNLWLRLAELKMDVTLVSGVHDQKFTDIANRIASECVNAKVRRVETDTGHAVPLELPNFLASIL